MASMNLEKAPTQQQQQQNNNLNNNNNKDNNKHQLTTSFYSSTLLLNSKISFISAKEFENNNNNNNNSDKDFVASLNKLKKKYKVFEVPTGGLHQDSQQKQQNECSSVSLNGFHPSSSSSSSSSSASSSGSSHCVKQQKSNIPSAATKSNDNKWKDDEELGNPKRIIFPREKIHLDWKHIVRIGAGLENLGNVCYMNSILQSLTYCPPLVNYLLTLYDENHHKKCQLSFCMLCVIMRVVSKCLNNRTKTVQPIELYNKLQIIAKHFTKGRQEDAHEFLRYVIDHMCRAALDTYEQELGIPGLISKSDKLSKETTAINHIFGGYHRSQVTCMICKAKSNTYDHFMDFMLDIQGISSLDGALEKYVKAEVLRNENAYKCLKCKQSVVALKQITIFRAPNVATFQFKRFDSNRTFNKIHKPISFPEILDLRPYMTDSNGPPLKYKLFSVVVHDGISCNSGHYYSFVRNSNNFWYKMEDANVSQCSLSEVLKQQAYILLYIRNNHNNNTATNEKNLVTKIPNTPPPPNQTRIPLKQANNSSCYIVQNQQNNNQGKLQLNRNFEFNLNNNNNNNNNNSNKNNNNNNSSNKLITTIPYKSSIITINQTPSKATLANIESIGGAASAASSSTRNGLVPYDEDDKNDEQDQKGDDQLKSNEINEDSSTVASSSSLTKDIKVKIKATTDSWKVIRIQDNDNNNNEHNQYHNKSILDSNWEVSKINDDVDGSSSKFSETTLINTDNNNINKKKKKKKKSKKRKRNDDEDNGQQQGNEYDDDDDDDDDNVELKWIERTQETIQEQEMGNEFKRNKLMNNDNNNNNNNTSSNYNQNDQQKPKIYNVVDALVKNSKNGFNDVRPWNPNSHSSFVASIKQIQEKRFHSDDDNYDEEFDRGKISKPKNKIDTFSLLKNKNKNPFQEKYKSINESFNNNNNFNKKKKQDNNNYNRHHSHHNNNKHNNNNKSKHSFNSSSSYYNDKSNNAAGGNGGNFYFNKN